MACIKEVTVLELSAEWLRAPMQLEDWVTVGERKYFKLRKTDPKIERALCGEAPGKRRRLTNTTIVEDLTKLRNEAHARASREVERGNVEDDLGFDDEVPPAKKPKRSKVHLPDTLEIEAPPQGASEGPKLRALTASGFEPLWLELSETAINYLRAAVVAQMADETPKGAPAKTHPSPSLGVYWCASKGAWRIRFTEGGKLKTRFFKPEDADDETSVAAAAAEASACLQEQENS